MPTDDVPESIHIAAGNGYSDADRTESLRSLTTMLNDLRQVPAWRLTPYTGALLDGERSIAAVWSGLLDQPGVEDQLDTAAEDAARASVPFPVETDESTATWEADPFEVVADWSGRTLPLVHLDGQTIAPDTARRLAAVLLAAADRAEAGQ